MEPNASVLETTTNVLARNFGLERTAKMMLMSVKSITGDVPRILGVSTITKIIRIPEAKDTRASATGNST
jgi:acetamidase/formamidase